MKIEYVLTGLIALTVLIWLLPVLIRHYLWYRNRRVAYLMVKEGLLMIHSTLKKKDLEPQLRRKLEEAKEELESMEKRIKTLSSSIKDMVEGWFPIGDRASVILKELMVYKDKLD